MTFEQLDQVFANARNMNTKLKMWMGIIGGGIGILGVVLLFTVENPTAGYVVLGMSAIFLLFMLPIIHIDGKKAFEKGQKLKETLTKKPENLVWMYVRRKVKTNSGLTNIWVVLNLRDGTRIDLHQKNLPNQDENTFIASMCDTYNPKCALGYSNELHRQYLDGKL